MSPALVDRRQGNVYAALSVDHYEEHLVALDFTTGIERWRLEVMPTYESPAHPFVFQVYEDLALVSDPEQRVVALDATTGAKQWRSDDVYYFPDSVIRSGVIWAVSLDDPLLSAVALDVRTGNVRWRTPLVKPVGPTFSDAWVTLEAVVGDTAYVVTFRSGDGRSEHTLHALNASTGIVRWQRESEGEFTYAHGVPYVGTGRQVANNAAFNSPVASTRWVYLNDGYHLYALDSVSGVERWRFWLGTPDDHYPVPTSVGKIGVYVEDHGHLSMLDPETGDVRWVFERSVDDVRLGCRVCLEIGEVVYVVSADNSIYALDVRTGSERGRFEFSAAPSADALFEPILQRIQSGFVRIAEEEARLLRKHAATAQATTVLTSIERRLGAYSYRLLPEEQRVTEVTAIGALLDLLWSRSDSIDQPVTNRSGDPYGSVFDVLSPVPVTVVKDTLYVTTPNSVYALRVTG